MRHYSPLLRELLRLARERGWSRAELAARLDVHPTLLTHLQAGRRRMSATFLSRILRVFPDIQTVRDLALNYLVVEIPQLEALDERIAGGEGVASKGERLPDDLRGIITTYVAAFLRSYYEGRGMLLLGTDTALLRGAARLLAAECELRRIQVVQMDASAKISATLARAAVHANLLVVERIDFATPAVIEILLRRADLVKPSVATLAGTVDAIPDAHLKRVVLSMMRRIDCIPTAAPIPAVHA